jgi:hypothetical protein
VVVDPVVRGRVGYLEQANEVRGGVGPRADVDLRRQVDAVAQCESERLGGRRRERNLVRRPAQRRAVRSDGAGDLHVRGLLGGWAAFDEAQVLVDTALEAERQVARRARRIADEEAHAVEQIGPLLDEATHRGRQACLQLLAALLDRLVGDRRRVPRPDAAVPELDELDVALRGARRREDVLQPGVDGAVEEERPGGEDERGDKQQDEEHCQLAALRA